MPVQVLKLVPAQYTLQRVGGLCLGIREGHRTEHGTGFMLSSTPRGPRLGIGETQLFTQKIHYLTGIHTDVSAPDMGTNPQ
jgi:hypothetical protein